MDEVSALTLEGVSGMLRQYLRPDNIEINVVGDFDAVALEGAFLNYMGTIAKRNVPLPLPHVPITFHQPPLSERHQVRVAHCSLDAAGFRWVSLPARSYCTTFHCASCR